jgi:hypothetical protein
VPSPRRPLSFVVAATLPVLAGVFGGLPLAARPDDPPVGPPPPAAPRRSPDRAAERAWLDESGSAVLGFGLLRVAPATKGTPGRLTLRYAETPSDYAAFDAIQLVVLPARALRTEGRCFADATLAFGRSPAGTYETTVSFEVRAPELLVVGYGPFVGTDTSRPTGTARAYTLEVTDAKGVSRTWVDAEVGELQVKGWTARPELERGGPTKDPVTGKDHWFEVRPEILYDPDRIRAPDDPETPAAAAARREADTLRSRAKDLDAAGKPDAAADLRREADDVLETLAALDDRIPLPAPLVSRLRRIPFRWR